MEKWFVSLLINKTMRGVAPEQELTRRAFYYTQTLSTSLRSARFLIKVGGYTQWQLDRALITAAHKGRLHLVRVFYEQRTECGQIALNWAAWKGRTQVVEFLLGTEDTFDIDAPFFSAARNGHIDLVQDLALKGADIHTMNEAPLRWASRNGHLRVVQYLVDAGADIHADEGTPLLWAASRGHFAVVHYLAKLGALAGVQTRALCWAASGGHHKVVQYLTQVHVYHCFDKNNAVTWAAENGHLKVVRHLVQKGANAKNEPAFCAAVVAGQFKVVQYMIQAGVNIHVHGEYALIKAAKHKHVKVAQLLVDAGADKNKAMRCAQRRGNIHMVELLERLS